MADFKYIMQGFQKDINFFDEIKEVLETEDYTSIWILTAFVNERAICNLMPSIKKSKADISFIIGIRNNVSTYQALKCLINMKVSVFVFDTARIESIFHAIYAMIDSLSDEELFKPHMRKWADEATKTAVWEVYKFIHVNTVAPFGTFRTKIRKWKKIAL